MDEQERKIGRNEALYRRVNERLQDVNDTFGALTGDFEIVCECGDLDCTETISMMPEQYADVRADPRWFVIVPGHVATDVEDVVERFDRYEVVQKHEGTPTHLAVATEPPDR